MNKPLIYLFGLVLSLASFALILEFAPVAKLQTEDPVISFNEFDEIVQMPVSHISPIELADALMKQEQHYNLFDLRQGEVDYRIPTAEVATIEQIIERKLPVNEVIWLYSDNETTALQLYYLLVIRGYFKVKVLTAGMAGWKQQIIMPNVDEIPASQHIHRKAVSEFFGGNFSTQTIKFTPKSVEIIKKHKKHHGC